MSLSTLHLQELCLSAWVCVLHQKNITTEASSVDFSSRLKHMNLGPTADNTRAQHWGSRPLHLTLRWAEA